MVFENGGDRFGEDGDALGQAGPVGAERGLLLDEDGDVADDTALADGEGRIEMEIDPFTSGLAALSWVRPSD
jgi:hypothetical protein